MNDSQTSPPSSPARQHPDWASLTAVVTVSTVFAFTTSSFYVFAVGLNLPTPLAIYFSPTDYLRITPSWAIPTLGYGVLLLLSLAVVGFPILNLQRMHIRGLSLEWPADFNAFMTRSSQDFFGLLPNLYKRSSWAFLSVVFIMPTILIYGSLFLIKYHVHGNKATAIALVTLISLIFLFYLSCGASFFPASALVRALLILILWLVTSAVTMGKFYKPVEILEAPLSRVLFESEKDRFDAVEGHVIFDLDRYLLILTQSERRGSVVAIPHEKVISIETPPLRQQGAALSRGD